MSGRSSSTRPICRPWAGWRRSRRRAARGRRRGNSPGGRCSSRRATRRPQSPWPWRRSPTAMRRRPRRACVPSSSSRHCRRTSVGSRSPSWATPWTSWTVPTRPSPPTPRPMRSWERSMARRAPSRRRQARPWPGGSSPSSRLRALRVGGADRPQRRRHRSAATCSSSASRARGPRSPARFWRPIPMRWCSTSTRPLPGRPGPFSPAATACAGWLGWTRRA